MIEESTDHHEEKPYRVGPGCPPREYQWKPGQPSPNPAGRPRKKPKELLSVLGTPLEDMIIRLGLEKMLVREGGVQSELPAIEANVRMIRRRAMQGHSRDQDKFLKIYAEALRSKKAYAESILEAAARHKYLWSEKFALAEKRGLPVPNVLPHPQDVIIHGNGNIEIVGPVSYEQLKALEDCLEYRDDLIKVIDIVKERLDIDPDNTTAQRILRGLRRRMNKIQNVIPPRLRWSE